MTSEEQILSTLRRIESTQNTISSNLKNMDNRVRSQASQLKSIDERLRKVEIRNATTAGAAGVLTALGVTFLIESLKTKLHW
jgi:hypothetical protein